MLAVYMDLGKSSGNLSSIALALLVGWCERHRSADQIQDPQPCQRDHVIQPIERQHRFRADRGSAALTEAPTAG
jgi:hypothetical protein